MSKPIIVLVGYSGSGKNFIPKVLGMKYTPGNTTREKRDSDESMTYHNIKEVKHFQNINLFDLKICGETYFHENYYWTSIKDYNDEQYDYMILSPEGLMNLVKKHNFHKRLIEEKIKAGGIVPLDKYLYRDYKVVFFECSERQRKKNMKKRGEKRSLIRKRIKNERELYKGIKDFIVKELNGIVINL